MREREEVTMNKHKKQKPLYTAIIAALGGISLNAQATLTTGASLNFNNGHTIVTGCLVGNLNTAGTSCTVGTAVNVTDIGGSYFRMNQGGPAAQEKTPISMFAPLKIGTTQISSGAHSGFINGSESPAIDSPWEFLGNTGMHSLASPVSDLTGSGVTRQLDLSGWGVNWGGFDSSNTNGTISVPGTATLVCSSTACAHGDTYTLDMNVHIAVAFTSVPYSLHLEGTIAAPLPAAGWLFLSGAAGLAGIARRRRRKP